jgi:hypothetical protein
MYGNKMNKDLYFHDDVKVENFEDRLRQILIRDIKNGIFDFVIEQQLKFEIQLDDDVIQTLHEDVIQAFEDRKKVLANG